ncbi:MAG: GNAT family N-acetyltransferase [Bacteroidales bacterium]|jgi:ribosomal protein S18 acetylase RimI-like enzyme|nr:GNAT family N-acetyltransferase [Bacteroidales bacterium]
MQVRQIQTRDYPMLEEFLYHAIFVPAGTEPPPREIIFIPEIFIYIKDFGGKDDCGAVAEHNGQIVGAAWTRIIPAYGYIDDRTPELAISILPAWRSQGIGGKLMTHLFDLLRERGYRQTSLSVQKENRAAQFYGRLGYRIIKYVEEHGDYLMVKDL